MPCSTFTDQCLRQARITAPPTFTPGANALAGPLDQSVAHPLNGTDGAVALSTGALPFASGSILPARPNLPDDPVIPHNGFSTFEESEKAFFHLLRKAGVDANWTWDQTMRAIITDPLYKALNTLAEKKAAWQKVHLFVFSSVFRSLIHTAM
jgi:pre-mRNA-processing factor 40